MLVNPADSFLVDIDRPGGGIELPTLGYDELDGLIQIGAAGGMLARGKLHPQVVRQLLDTALVWPKGHTALGLTARGIQILASAARRARGDA
jgi:hypothetical protein